MKKVLITLAFFITGAVSIGLYQYFRTPEKAMEQKPVFEGSADGFAGILLDSEWETGAVVQLSDTIQSAESKSITFPNGIIVTKDTSDHVVWPTEGYITVKGLYQGKEVDEFFGETLIRVSGAFLLEPTKSENLN
jgi:outer membrane protein assembly factor BamA